GEGEFRGGGVAGDEPEAAGDDLGVELGDRAVADVRVGVGLPAGRAALPNRVDPDRVGAMYCDGADLEHACLWRWRDGGGAGGDQLGVPDFHVFGAGVVVPDRYSGLVRGGGDIAGYFDGRHREECVDLPWHS